MFLLIFQVLWDFVLGFASLIFVSFIFYIVYGNFFYWSSDIALLDWYYEGIDDTLEWIRDIFAGSNDDADAPIDNDSQQ